MLTNARLQTLIFGLLLIVGVIGVSPNTAVATDISSRENAFSSLEQPRWLKRAIGKEARAYDLKRIPFTNRLDFEMLGAIRHRDNGKFKLWAGITTSSLSGLLGMASSMSLVKANNTNCSIRRYGYSDSIASFGCAMSVGIQQFFAGVGIAMASVGVFSGTVLILDGIKQRKRGQNHLRKMGFHPDVKKSAVQVSIHPEISLKKQGFAMEMTF